MPEIMKGYSRLKNSERHHSKDAKLLGPADEKEVLKVTIIVRRRPDAAPMPESDYFLNPPSQRRGLSENEFAVKYGASDQDLAKVSEFAKEHQLNVIETNAARRTVIAA